MSIVSTSLSKAASHLMEGEVVAIPTETVYGLAGNIFDEAAIRKIFAVKQRPLFNPLIVHLHSLDQLEEIVAEFPPKARQLAEAFWPGPLTLILKKQPKVPDLITAGKDTVAVRIPNHPVTLELLKQLPFPLAAPSANPFNRISPTKSEHVADYFENDIPMVLEGGECQKGLESTIVGFEGDEPIVYRFGALALEDLEKVVGKLRVKNKKENAPTAPGMLAKHYSPRTKMYLVENLNEFLDSHKNTSIGVLKFTGEPLPLEGIHTEILSQTGDLNEGAARLYDALHRLDRMGFDCIVAERFPDWGLGKTINDRLERAANN